MKWTEAAVAQELGVIQQTVNSWISDSRARQRANRNIIIIRLNRLACPPSFWRGWSQEKISEAVGLSQNRVSEIIGNTNFGNIDNLLSQGHDMDYIAKHYHMDLALTRPLPSSGIRKLACARAMAGRWRAGPPYFKKQEDQYPGASIQGASNDSQGPVFFASCSPCLAEIAGLAMGPHIRSKGDLRQIKRSAPHLS